MDDLISRQAAIFAIEKHLNGVLGERDYDEGIVYGYKAAHRHIQDVIAQLPSAQPERLTDDDIETIRIHLSAFKEDLCNQHRWEEAEEYQRIINRFMSFANARQERKDGRWLPDNNCHYETRYICSECKLPFRVETFMMKPSWRFCPNCGARMEVGD